MDRRYLASLAGAAVAILVVGLLIKPTDAIRGAMPGVSEAAPLQQLSQEGDLRNEASYFSERVAALEDQVVYVADARSSGLRWTGIAGIVTTGVSNSPITVVTSTNDSANVPAALPSDSPDRTRWVLVVARLANGKTVSVTGLHGGVAPARCGDDAVQEIVLSAPLHDVFAGGGLFDLNGKRLGLVVRCPQGLIAMPAREVESLIRRTRSVAWRMLDQLGLGVTALDPGERALFDADSGVVVREVRRNSIASTWGLRPGDVIERIDGGAVHSADDLRVLLDEPATVDVVRVRRGQRSRIELSRAGPGRPQIQDDTSLELSTSSIGIEIMALGRETAAFHDGLRNGDIILELDGNRPAPGSVRSALLGSDSVAHFVVMQRGDIQRGIVIRPR